MLTVAEWQFENDVKTYSIQTLQRLLLPFIKFENDVKTYSIQTLIFFAPENGGLRMM